MPSIFVKGLIIGFALAAPVGPIAAICVQRTMSRGRLAGFVSGFGSAAADAVYGTAAAFGASFISEFLVAHGTWLQKVGGAILVILGVRLLFTRPRPSETVPGVRGLAGLFFSTFFLTLTNPMTFLAFGAIFATMGLGAVEGHSIFTFDLVAGVVAGAALWWSLLVIGVHALRRHFSYEKLVWVNRGAGAFVIVVGILYMFVLHGGSVAPRLEKTLHRLAGIREGRPAIRNLGESWPYGWERT
ncbi:MAG: LysE family transporter [Acidobacteriota bacterium]